MLQKPAGSWHALQSSWHHTVIRFFFSLRNQWGQLPTGTCSSFASFFLNPLDAKRKSWTHHGYGSGEVSTRHQENARQPPAIVDNSTAVGAHEPAATLIGAFPCTTFLRNWLMVITVQYLIKNAAWTIKKKYAGHNKGLCLKRDPPSGNIDHALTHPICWFTSLRVSTRDAAKIEWIGI